MSDCLLTRAQLCEIVPVSDMAIWRWTKRGAFPKPIFFSGRRYWRLSEINAWLERQAPREATGK